MKQSIGYSLLELMVSLAIMSLLSVTALPAIANFVQSQSQLSTSYGLINDINWARQAAVSYQRKITYCGSNDGKRCSKTWSKMTLTFINNDNDNKTLGEDDQLLNSRRATNNHTFFSWRAFKNKSYLVFLPNGFTDYQNGSFTLCPSDKNASHAKQIILNTAGRTRFSRDTDNNGVVNDASGSDLAC